MVSALFIYFFFIFISRIRIGSTGRNYNQFQLDAKIEFNCHVIKDLIESISRHNSFCIFLGTFRLNFMSLTLLFLCLFYYLCIYINLKMIVARLCFCFPVSSQGNVRR